MKILLQDYRDIEKQMEQVEKEMNFLAQLDIGMQGVKEMQTANSIAHSARMITILAFIFVPWSLASSIYGMDLSIFGQGMNVALKTWLYTGFGLLGLALLTLFLYFFPAWAIRERKKRRVKVKSGNSENEAYYV